MPGGSSLRWWDSTMFSRRDKETNDVEKERNLHRKRLANILRYIASMHQDANSYACHNFVRPINDDASSFEDFFQDRGSNEEENGVLFSSNDFRRLISVGPIEEKLSRDIGFVPFSFYAPSQSVTNVSSVSKRGGSNTNSKAYSLSSVFHPNKSLGGRNVPERGLWLRLTRLGPSNVMKEPHYNHPVLQNYLSSWLSKTSEARSIEDLLTLRNIDHAPSCTSAASQRHQKLVSEFLGRYKTYLRTKMYQKLIEPIYNALFEWNQQQNENHEEIVWGLGHAKMITTDGRLINGPILEILVEIELAPDGALLIRPREHTGVTLNREVASALVSAASDSASLNAVLSQLHKVVGNMETSSISPGQPKTYVPFLKRVAMELSSGGVFRASSDANSFPREKVSRRSGEINDARRSNLEVTEAWCLYARSKPSSVWARDANLLADRVGKHGEDLPVATWSLTHGPSKLERIISGGFSGQTIEARKSMKSSMLSLWLKNDNLPKKGISNDRPYTKQHLSEGKVFNKPIFPLATSDSQNQIADLLMRKNYPAVIAEGPPGTGKTHTIANIVSAYLCEGKRVLVTSKNANALSVLRNRLPLSVRELVVDVSMSESQGMRQLQQTVERLAVRVSVASTDIETEKRSLLQHSIDTLDRKLEEIDEKMMKESERVRKILLQPDGLQMIEMADDLMKSAPWLVRALPKMGIKEIQCVAIALKKLELNSDDPLLTVTGFDSPPSSSFISLVSAKSGSSLSSLSQATKAAFTSMPILGPKLETHMKELHAQLATIHLNGSAPESIEDWKTVTKALKHALAVHTFEESVWKRHVKEMKWPTISFFNQDSLKETSALMRSAVELKKLHVLLDVKASIDAITECRRLDSTRTRLSNQKQHHSEELADAAVVAELSRSFSPDAQSALIKFAQIAGAAKFSRSAKPSKMSQRQRRRRQEYLNAFDRCCRFIPCWILTTSQISDYLPPECLFDLVIIDESSQSDVAVLPGMMRGKQWLIVGDGKQVSPTEAFVSEENIENLRATLPDSPLEDALLPGRSFFDMCSQAFPKGRVVLTEHFRCAPEIIDFSNQQFYGGRLVPLRLPNRNERFVPSILDVKVRGGKKVGKVNEKEAEKIIEMIKSMIIESSTKKTKPISIGIISLIGDEQSRLIRGRLLDACGPESLARHNVLVGDPPQFQGAERDVVFLSMVCSRENCPTQNQQFHFQRANVALSRARDRVVLVRSVDLGDIPSLDDVKLPIIEFFLNAKNIDFHSGGDTECEPTDHYKYKHKKYFGREILVSQLKDKGYSIVDMSTIWKNAFCVEDQGSDNRIAILVDCEEPQQSDWISSYSQQIAIERVGWKCLRVDTLSVVVDYFSVLKDVVAFLTKHGIEDPSFLQSDTTYAGSQREFNERHLESKNLDDDEVINMDNTEDPTIKKDTEERKDVVVASDVDETIPENNQSSMDFSRHETVEAWKFGEVVDLDFLRVNRNELGDFSEDSSAAGERSPGAAKSKSNPKRAPDDFRSERNTDHQGSYAYDQIENEDYSNYSRGDTSGSVGRRRKRRKTTWHGQNQQWESNEVVSANDEASIPIEAENMNDVDDESWDEETL